MASRKEQKEALRKEREAREAAAAAEARRRRLIGYAAGGAVALVAVVVAVVLLASGGGGDSKGKADESSDVLPRRRIRTGAEGHRPRPGSEGGRLRAQELSRQEPRAHRRPEREDQVRLRPADRGQALPGARRGRRLRGVACEGPARPHARARPRDHLVQEEPADRRPRGPKKLFDDDSYHMVLTPDDTMKYAVAATAWNRGGPSRARHRAPAGLHEFHRPRCTTRCARSATSTATTGPETVLAVARRIRRHAAAKCLRSVSLVRCEASRSARRRRAPARARRARAVAAALPPGPGRLLDRALQTAAPAWRAPVRAPKRFNMVGLTWRGGGEPEIRVRARREGGGWSPWAKLAAHSEDGPDPGQEGGSAGTSAPAVGRQRRLGPVPARQRRVRGARLAFVNTRGDATATDRASNGFRRLANSALLAVAGAARLRARTPPTGGRRWSRAAQWGAADCVPREPAQLGEVRTAFVHHTVSLNDYTRRGAGRRARHLPLPPQRRTGGTTSATTSSSTASARSTRVGPAASTAR